MSPTDDDIERAAHAALHADHPEASGWSGKPADVKEHYRHIARAVLEAAEPAEPEPEEAAFITLWMVGGERVVLPDPEHHSPYLTGARIVESLRRAEHVEIDGVGLAAHQIEAILGEAVSEAEATEVCRLLVSEGLAEEHATTGKAPTPYWRYVAEDDVPSDDRRSAGKIMQDEASSIDAAEALLDQAADTLAALEELRRTTGVDEWAEGDGRARAYSEAWGILGEERAHEVLGEVGEVDLRLHEEDVKPLWDACQAHLILANADPMRLDPAIAGALVSFPTPESWRTTDPATGDAT